MALAKAWSGSNSFLRAISDSLVYNNLDIRYSRLYGLEYVFGHTPLKEFSYENAMELPFPCRVDRAVIVCGAAGKGTRTGCKRDQLTNCRSRRRDAALPNGGTRPGSDSAAWLHANFTHVAAHHPATRREIHGDRTRPARHWRFVDSQGRYGHEERCDPHSCARQIAPCRQSQSCRP